MDEEERNYCCLALLLLRVGNPCLRRYFKNQWDAAGTFSPWTDCAQNGTDLLKIFEPLQYERKRVKSGDTSQWDISLLVKALLHSLPPFVVATNLVAALKTFKKKRDNLCHSPNPRVKATDFQTSWRDVCNALSLFGATVEDFDKVEQDVQKPWSELLPILNHCAVQDQAILDTLDSFNSKLEQLQQGQDNIAEGQDKLLQGQHNIEEGQDKLLQGQNNSAEGRAKLQQGLDTILKEILSIKKDQKKGFESHTTVDQQGQNRSSADVQTALGKPIVTRPKKESVNFVRLCRLLIDGGTQVLRDVFDSIHPPSFLQSTLLNTSVRSTLKALRARKILTKQQWVRLYPASRSTAVTSADFDITLLFVLLRNICGLTPPTTGWDKPPVATDMSKEADLARVKYYRNKLFSYITETAVSDSDFEKYWYEISDVLVRLGGPHYKSFAESTKVEIMDIDFTTDVDEIAGKHEASSKPLVTRTMPREFDNFARLIRLTIDGGNQVFRDVFDSIHPPSSLQSTLLNTTVHSILKALRARRILTKQQWDRLYPATRSTPVTSADFDITLLFVLLRNICGLTPPPTGWDKLPVATNLSREADLVRLENYRNDILSGATTVSDREIESYWSEISDVLVRLGGPRYKSFIERIKVENMDLDFTTAADEIAGKHEDDTIPSEILARGPEALKAYEEALKSGKTKNRRLLVMVVGPARAGKTSLLKSLNGEEFEQKVDSTNGIQLLRTFCKSQENCWNKEIDKGISYADCMADVIHKNLQGGDDSEEIHAENFAKARKESIEKLVGSSESLSNNNDDDRDEDYDDSDDANEDDEADDDDVHGNDDDKMNAIKVECEEINEEANEELENQEYVSQKSTANLPKPIEDKLVKLIMDTELSDKTNRENEVYIKSLDFAGQAVYNVIHPIFLTSKAVFILVYNLKNIPHDRMKSIVEKDDAERELVDPFEMTNLENLELWLSCISSYTDTQKMGKIGEFSLPLVFIAGTHADKFDGNLEAARKIIREIYKSLSPSKNPSGCHVVRNQIYTVNNSVSGNGKINDESVRKLKADIEELSKSLPHMDEDIPITWLWFEEVLSNLVEKENKKYITIDEALKMANECKVNTSAESKEFLTLLNYLHDLKTVIYFEETKKVFIDTEWLVKVFTKVIEVRPVEKRDGFDESWDKLEEKGVLDRALVEHVWKRLNDERNTIDSLLLIMEKFSLICRWNTSEGEEVYLVPCMLCNSEKREDIAKCLEHEKSSTMVVHFNTSHLSLGIFPRLFVAIAEELKKIWPNLEKPELHKNFCRIFEIGKERNLDICIIQSSFQTICVTVCNIQDIDGQQVTEFCHDFRKLLDQIFDEMWRNFPWMQNMTFEYGILCPVCTTSPNKCKSHEIEGCTRDTCLHFVNGKELSVDTPKCKKYVANLDNVIEEKAYVYWFPRQAHQLQVEEFGRCENFALGHEHQVPVTDLQKTLNGMKPSIGAIIAINISNVRECGATCFRIGTKYVITNKHVIDDLCKSGIQSWSSCYIDFNYNEQGQPGYRVDFAPNPVSFTSEELDYVILELCSNNGGGFPPSVTDLGYNIAPPGHQLKSGEYLTLIGHPGGRRKQIDVTCPIKLQQDIQKDLHKYDASTVSLVLEACNHPDRATYDVSTFFEGASGSPGILMEKKLLVVLHKGGIFHCTNRVLEYGILMSSIVKDVMTKIPVENAPIQNVLDDIFGGSTSQYLTSAPCGETCPN